MFRGKVHDWGSLSDDSLQTFIKVVDQGINPMIKPCRRWTVSMMESAYRVLYSPSFNIINYRNGDSIGVLSLYAADYIPMEAFCAEYTFNRRHA